LLMQLTTGADIVGRKPASGVGPQSETNG
jgi:hypothetical protein